MASKIPQKFFNFGYHFGRTSCLESQRFSLMLGSSRTLFTAEALGIDGYEKQRNRVKQQFAGMDDKFRSKMKEFALSDSKNMIFTEDLKNMVHLVESKPEDLELVHHMMKRFNQQNRHLRFGNFIFGPVVMRMYHHLNEAQNALEAFQDPQLEGFFDQLGSYQILCDLLYNSGMYEQVLEVFDSIRSKQTTGTKFPRNVVVLAFAACYKMNTLQSYEYALKALTEMKNTGIEPVRRVIAFASALTLNQNAPQIALEILSTAKQPNYVTIRNLRCWALADLNRPDDIMPLLRVSLEYDNPNADRRSTVCPDVLDIIAASVEKLGNKEVSSEFEGIRKSLKETNQISVETLEQILNQEIERPLQNTTGGGLNRQSMLERSFQIGRSINLRPRQNQAYERERRNILSD